MKGSACGRTRARGASGVRIGVHAHTWLLDALDLAVPSRSLRRTFEGDDRQVLPAFEEGHVPLEPRTGSAADPRLRGAGGIASSLQSARATRKRPSFR